MGVSVIGLEDDYKQRWLEIKVGHVVWLAAVPVRPEQATWPAERKQRVNSPSPSSVARLWLVDSQTSCALTTAQHHCCHSALDYTQEKEGFSVLFSWPVSFSQTWRIIWSEWRISILLYVHDMKPRQCVKTCQCDITLINIHIYGSKGLDQ